jgi:hypothetical protein
MDHGKGTPAFHYGMSIISGADVNFFTDLRKEKKKVLNMSQPANHKFAQH